MPAEGFDEDVFGCLPGEVADVAANRLVVCCVGEQRGERQGGREGGYSLDVGALPPEAPPPPRGLPERERSRADILCN